MEYMKVSTGLSFWAVTDYLFKGGAVNGKDAVNGKEQKKDWEEGDKQRIIDSSESYGSEIRRRETNFHEKDGLRDGNKKKKIVRLIVMVDIQWQMMITFIFEH